MFPYPRKNNFDVLLFPSIFSVENTLREITIKTSFLVRILTTARVSNLYWVIQSEKEKRIINTVNFIIKYALTPHYLRKYIKLDKRLRFVGLLDPINTPYNAVSKEPVEGEVRMGFKVRNSVDVGLNNLFKIKGDFFLVVDSKDNKIMRYYDIYYKGFNIKYLKIDELKTLDNLIIGSRNGKNPFKDSERIRRIYREKGIKLLIGPPDKGCIEILGEEVIENAYNFFPYQGNKDIRSEEALAYALAILNAILS